MSGAGPRQVKHTSPDHHFHHQKNGLYHHNLCVFSISAILVLHLTHEAVKYIGSLRFDYWNLLRGGWGLKIFWSILIFYVTFFLKAKNKYVIVRTFFSLFMIFFHVFLGNLRGVISITFFPQRPRFSPIGQRKVKKKDFRWLSGSVNRGIIFFPIFQVFNGFVDEFKVRSAMIFF